MQNSGLTNQPELYLAPLQGFTDFVYRKIYAQNFPWIDKYFIPYISVKNHEIIKKYEREVLPANNPQTNAIPQVLAANAEEILFLAQYLAGFGYTEINLNLGCPYPMVTHRGMGAGLLVSPNKIEQILEAFFANTNLRLSVKMRAGFLSPAEIENVVPVLNRFPLTEVILHPRVAKQLYTGEIHEQACQFAASNLSHRLVYNGDIVSVENLGKLQQKFQAATHFMLGRGILMNPFLPAEIKGIVLTATEKQEKLFAFHRKMLEEYLLVMDNRGNALNKMKQFWSWFSFSFENQKKLNKQIQKSKGLAEYQKITNTAYPL